MYAGHFGLIERPFSIAPDPRYLFMSERHREALAHLLYGVREAGGIVLLTGEVGTGKTVVCRALLARLPADVDVALVLNPRVTATELLATVCDELRIPRPRDVPTSSSKALVDTLSGYLLDAHARGRRTVVIVDEAQNLAVETLEQIRLLTNFETTREKLLQIVLIGQPELLAMLRQPDLRQLAQRVTARYHLLPFSERESRAYIRHRLTLAGQSGAIFEPAALGEVHRRARGVPRLINTICDRALLGAWANNRRRVTRAIAARAAGEVLGRRPRRLGRVPVAAALVALAFLGTLAAVPGRQAVARLGAMLRLDRMPAPLAALVTLSRPPSAAVAPPGAPPPAHAMEPVPAARLADLLADGVVTSDRATALATLWSLWRLEGRPRADAGCAGVRAAGLQCLARAGTWTVLRRLDVPAVLELVAADGGKHYGVLLRLGPTGATLRFGAQDVEVPLPEIERSWDGPFVALVRRPPVGAVPLTPGMRGGDVAWLRGRLAQLGILADASATQAYDEELQAAVTIFQQRAGLVVDGVAGEETLARLIAASDTATPSLAGEVR